jgi:hypothetical protein
VSAGALADTAKSNAAVEATVVDDSMYERNFMAFSSPDPPPRASDL